MVDKAVKDLAPMAFAIVSVVITVGLGAVVLTQMQTASYDTETVLGESNQPSSPLPANYTLDESTDSDFVQVTSATVVLEDSSAGTNTTLTEGTDYELYKDEGKVELQSSPGGVTYDDTSDQVYTDYDYEQEGQATTLLGDGQNALGTFGDFLQVLVVVGVAAVIFLLLGGLRRAGGRSMA